MYNQNIVVNRRVQNEQGENVFEKVGYIVGPTPHLSDFGLDAEIKEQNEDGSPVYVEQAHNYLQACIAQQVRTVAKGRCKPGTTELKEGSKIPETFAEIITPVVSGGGGSSKSMHYKEFSKAFREWIADNRSAKVSTIFSSLVVNRNGIALARDLVRSKLAEAVVEFADTLSEEDQAKFEAAASSVINHCEAEEELDF